MLRYLVWRLMFEASNIKRLFGHGEGQVYYLAFGANLSDAIMAERRITPFAARYYTLRDHGLRFDHPAPWADCGYASAEPAAGESVHGILYTLSERDAARMDFYEAVPVIRRYRRSWVEQDGERIYFYRTNRSTPNLKPTDEYLGYILGGLENHPDAGDDYRAELARMPTAQADRMVSSYLWEQPAERARWQRMLVDLYQKTSLLIFIRVVYPFSPTAPFIRVKARR